MTATTRELTTLVTTVGLAGFVLLVLAVASTGAMFKPGGWYEALAKPDWTPPNWLFPIAWALLYLTIACAGWLVWRAVGFGAAGIAFLFYFTQLALNAAWSWLFFGLHRMDLALVEITILWITVLANIVAFYLIRPGAAFLLIPYLMWLT